MTEFVTAHSPACIYARRGKTYVTGIVTSGSGDKTCEPGERTYEARPNAEVTEFVTAYSPSRIYAARTRPM